MALTSLYDDLASSGRQPATTVLDIVSRTADDDIAALLSVPVGTAVLSVERLRLADGTPLALMHNYLPAGQALLPQRAARKTRWRRPASMSCCAARACSCRRGSR